MSKIRDIYSIMGTITNVGTPSAQAILSGPNEPLSNLSNQVPQSVLQSASAADLVSLSTAARGLEETTALFDGPSAENPPTADLTILSAVYGVALPSSTSATTDPVQALLADLYGTTPASASTASSVPATATPPAAASASSDAPAPTAGTLVDTFG